MAQICTMIPVAETVGSRRMVPSGGIIAPTGSPELGADAERAFRRRLVERALDSLPEKVEGQRIYERS